MSRLTRDGTAEPVSRDQILRRERGQGNIHLPCSTDHERDWQPYPVDPYSCYMCDGHTVIYMVVMGVSHHILSTLMILVINRPSTGWTAGDYYYYYDYD